MLISRVTIWFIEFVIYLLSHPETPCKVSKNPIEFSASLILHHGSLSYMLASQV